MPLRNDKIMSFFSKHLLLHLFGLNYLVIFLFYNTLIVVPHYSSDTYYNYVFPINNVYINISHGRYVAAAIYQVFEWAHFDYTHHVLLGQLLWIAVYAWAVAALAIRFGACMKNAGVEWKLNAVFLLIACNLGAMENMLFPDIIYTSFISRAFVFGAAVLWCTQNKKIWHYAVSFVLLCLTLDMYQTHVGIYIILGTAFVLAQFKLKISAKAVREEAILLAIGIIASAQSLILMKLPSILGRETSSYAAEMSADILADNVKQILQAQPRIWFGFLGFLPPYAPAVFFGAAMVVMIVVLYRKKVCSVSDAVVIGMAFLGCVFMPFAPQIFAETVWIPPRTLEALFSFLILPGLLVLLFGGKTSGKIILGVYVAFFAVLFVQVQRISINNAMSSAVDEEFCRQIESEIEKYEQTTGNTVDTVAVGYDTNREYSSYKSVEYSLFDTNLSAFATPWSDVYSLAYYSGRSLERRDMTEEEYRKYFGESEWSVFSPEEQIRFEGNTMFWALY